MAKTDIFIDVSSGVVRVVLRIYFSVILIVVAVVGALCCDLYVRKSLSRKGSVKVLRTMGWLSPFDVVKVIWLTRSLPIGWLGVVMLLTSLLMTGSDLAVSGLVVDRRLPSRCNFDTSLPYIIYAADDSIIGPSEPEYAGYTYGIVTAAQRNSVANGGADAVYKKFNTDPNFKPDSQDIYGQWNCTDLGQDETYDENISAADIISDLRSRGVLYNATKRCDREYKKPGIMTFNQLAVWSANDSSGGPWDIRASLDITPSATDTKVMKTFHCQLDTPNAALILRHIDALPSLGTWCQTLEADLYIGQSATRNFSSTAVANITSGLNTMTMNAGILQSEDTLLIADPTQGCLVDRTVVPVLVTVLLALVTAGLLGMLAYWAFLSFSLGENARTKAVNGAPVGLLGWMLYGESLATGSAAGTSVTADLKAWRLAADTDLQLRWAKAGENADSQPLVDAGTWEQPPTMPVYQYESTMYRGASSPNIVS